MKLSDRELLVTLEAESQIEKIKKKNLQILPPEMELSKGGHVLNDLSLVAVRQRLLAIKALKHNNIRKAARELGLDITTAGKAFRSFKSQEMVKMILDDIIKQEGVELSWRLKKLKLTIDRSMPDSDGDINIDLYNPACAISGVAEINKMAGDRAPTKTINATLQSNNLDDLKELVEKYEKDY